MTLLPLGHALILNRRDWLTVSGSLLLADEDLTSQLYNPDGSLKVDAQAKTRTVQGIWDLTSQIVSINGSNLSQGNTLQWKYVLPDKWSTDYKENNVPACNQITVYQMAEEVPSDLLQTATKRNLLKSLGIEQILGLSKADLISGRTRRVEDQVYLDLDLGQAPDSCSFEQENLGLGFCPFDKLYLVSATLVQSKLMVIVVESDKDEWKLSSSDLKRVRSSFRVQYSS